MRSPKNWLAILLKPFRKHRAEQELDEELRFHLEKQVELNIAAGMSPDAARRQALVEFGGVQQTKERVREISWGYPLEALLQDVRYGLRMLRKNPVFTAIAVLTLGLGIGMNTSIFSLIDSILFRSLPASRPEDLVLLRWHAHHQPKLHGHSSYGDCPNNRSANNPNPNGCSFSLPFFTIARSQTNLFSGITAFAHAPQLDLSGNGAATIVNNAQFVSGEFFSTLGIKAALGRTLEPADDTPASASAVVLSYGYWQSAFGGSRTAVGRTIRLNGLPFTIVGVAQQGFSGLSPGSQFDLWVPLATRPHLTPRWMPKDDGGGSWWLILVARTKPGVSVQQAQTAVSLLYRNETLHEEKPLYAEADAPGVDVVPAQQGLEGFRRTALPPLYILMLAVALVLLIACANIAGLLLARAAGRSKEIAVRLMLGARRSRLVAQLLVESLLLSFAGGALGLLLARWGTYGLMVIATRFNSGPPPFNPQLDGRVLAFTAGTAILTGLFFGLIPALRSLRLDLTPALKTGSGASAAGISGSKWYSLGNALVVAQVSLAIVALITAGLLVRTLRNLEKVNLGFDAHNVLVFGLNPTLAGYKGTQLDPLYRDLQEKFAAVPSVTSVSYSWMALLTGGEWDTDIHIPGTPESERVDSDFMPVGPRFFETLRIPLLAGRDFSGADFSAASLRSARPPDSPPDPAAAPIPVIINETFARRFFPNINPLGRHVDEAMTEDKTRPRGPGWDVVGVVGNTKYEGLRREISPTMYVASGGNGWFTIRTAGDPMQIVPAIRDIINRRDNNLAMFRVATESQQIDKLVFFDRLLARFSTAFGLLAVALACIGLYGLLSYEVTRRTREIGIRVAIGAQRSNVIRMVVVPGLLLATTGAAVGTGASLGVSRLLSSTLYEVNPGDPVTLVGSAIVLIVVALAACYFPARRATRVDPLVALRYE